MRNKFAGTCYRCGKKVEVGEGHFERHAGKWRTQHAKCAIEHRHSEDDEMEQDAEEHDCGEDVCVCIDP